MLFVYQVLLYGMFNYHDNVLVSSAMYYGYVSYVCICIQVQYLVQYACECKYVKVVRTIPVSNIYDIVPDVRGTRCMLQICAFTHTYVKKLILVESFYRYAG